MFANQYIEDMDRDAVTFPFDCLPNEMKMHIIQHMSLTERENIGSIGNLNELVKNAGFNRFSNINVRSMYQAQFAAWEETSPQREIKDDELNQYFKHASTTELRIEGAMNEEIENKLKSAFKSLSFKELDITFSNEYSGRIISELICGSSGIEEVKIHWECIKDEIESAKEVLKSLPSMQKCKISGNAKHPLIDDDVLFHIVNQSSKSVDLDIRNTNVTARGLARAFEVFQKSEKNVEVRCFVSLGSLIQYLSTHGEDIRKLINISTLEHNSGATLWSTAPFSSLQHERFTDECAIIMRSNNFRKFF